MEVPSLFEINYQILKMEAENRRFETMINKSIKEFEMKMEKTNTWLLAEDVYNYAVELADKNGLSISNHEISFIKNNDTKFKYLDKVWYDETPYNFQDYAADNNYCWLIDKTTRICVRTSLVTKRGE